MAQLILIKSVLEPKDYSTLRSLLKKQQGEKFTPYIFKITNPQPLENYLSQQKISYEIYIKKEPNLATEQELAQAYREIGNDPQRLAEFKQWEKLGIASWQNRTTKVKN